MQKHPKGAAKYAEKCIGGATAGLWESSQCIKEGRIMTLYEGNAGSDYEISGIYVEDQITRRLEALGMNDKTKIHIVTKKKHGAMIIQVRGTRLALGRHIAQLIEVKGCQE